MSFIFCMFVLLITKTIIMKSNKPFWELGLNPITMLPPEKVEVRKEKEEITIARRERQRLSSLDNFNKDNYGRRYKKNKVW